MRIFFVVIVFYVVVHFSFTFSFFFRSFTQFDPCHLKKMRPVFWCPQSLNALPMRTATTLCPLLWGLPWLAWWSLLSSPTSLDASEQRRLATSLCKKPKMVHTLRHPKVNQAMSCRLSRLIDVMDNDSFGQRVHPMQRADLTYLSFPVLILEALV